MNSELLEAPTSELEEQPSSSEQELEPLSREYESVKEYSRDQSAEQRQELAQRLRKRRNIYRRNRDELVAQETALGQERELLQMRAELALSNLKETEQSLADLKTARVAVLPEVFSMMKSFLNRREIEVKGSEAMDIQHTLAAVQERQTEIDATHQELLEQLHDDTETRTIHDDLAKFYEQENSSWQEYEVEHRAGNVTELMKEHNVLFVHGISRFTPDANSSLQTSADLEDKFNIVLGLEPAISTSTIRPGDGRTHYWASQGLLLAGGTVTEAYTHDAATQPQGIFERSTIFQRTKQPLAEQIRGAIYDRDARNKNQWIQYNELVVEQPQPSAVYVALDEEPHSINYFDEARLDMPDIAEKLGLPLVVIEKGVPYRAVFDTIKHTLRAGEQIPIEELQQPVQLAQGQREKLISELFADSPFKPKTPEFDYIDARDEGRIAYLDQTLAHQSSIAEPIVIERLNGLRETYSSKNQRIMREVQWFDPRENQRRTREVYLDYERQHGHLSDTNEYTDITRHRTEKIGSGAKRTPATYLQSIRQTLERARQSAELAAQQSPQEYFQSMDAINQMRWKHDFTENGMFDEQGLMQKLAQHITESQLFWKDVVRQEASHVYGFGQEALAQGDTTSNEQAMQIVNEYYSIETIQEILERRTDGHGHFRNTIDDYPDLKKRQVKKK